MDIHDAISVPRVWNTGSTDVITYERPLRGYEQYAVTPETIAVLMSVGHRQPNTASSGAVQAIVFQDDGTLRGTADPRQDGKAVGVDTRAAPPRRR
jgi:gamma-glutamyltranspeptidase/glutathione hydrolase